MIAGTSHTTYHIVALEDTAIFQGSGQLEVLATPKLTFSVSAREGDKLIGEGTHVRFIVNKERFISKLK